MTIAIYTPTYNREKELMRLYSSLIKQSDKDFFWLIVDDGSTDDTALLIEELQRKNVIDIQYIKKENGGKHTAVNEALEIVDDYWNLCIDSDDWLISDESLEKIKKDIDAFDLKDNIISIVYPLKLIGKEIKDINRCPVLLKDSDARNPKLNVTEVTVVSRPRAYDGIRFPVFDKENFISEGAIEILKLYKGDRIYVNDPVVEGKYLDSGLTNNLVKNWKKNPNGYYYVRNISAKYYSDTKRYLKMLKPLGQMVALNFDSGQNLLYKIENKFIGSFSIPLGLLFWRKKFKK